MKNKFKYFKGWKVTFIGIKIDKKNIEKYHFNFLEWSQKKKTKILILEYEEDVRLRKIDY